MKNSNEQKILELIVDNKWNFKSHTNKLCKKDTQKIRALCRLSSYLNNSEKKIIFNLIMKSQFNYWRLVWIFCSKKLNSIISKLHERSIRIVLNDYLSDFNELLENNHEICNHHRNIRILLIKIFKIKNELTPPIMESILNRRVSTYNLSNFQEFVTERQRTVWYDLDTLSYRYPQPWSLLPETLKETNLLS